MHFQEIRSAEAFDRDRILEAVFQQRTRFMAVLAIDGTVLEVNEFCLQFTQLSRDLVIGKKFWETPWCANLFATQQLVQQEIQNAICNGTVISGEAEYAIADGTVRYGTYTITPLKNEQQQITNLLIESEDITDRRQQEMAIQERLSELETIYRTAPIGLCFHNSSLRFVRVNEKLAEINGVAVEDHIGRTLHEAIPVVADALEPIFQSVLTTGEPMFDLELHLATQGQPEVIRDWLASYVPVKSHSSEILGVNVMVQEITQLRQAEARLESILASITDAFAMFDRDWQLVYLNDRAVETQQRSREELLGQSLWEIFPDLTGTEVDRKLHQAIEQQVQTDLEFFYPTWNRWFEIRLYPSESGLTVFYTDTTERKRVKADRDRFFSLSLDMLVIAKFDGYFVRTNPAWTETLGWTEAELMAQPYLDLVHPDDRAATIAEAESLSAGNSTVQFENRYRHKSGSYRWLLWTVASFPQEQRLYAIAHDITNRKEIELERESLLQQEQAAREAAETANRIKDEFLAVLSHELRTPLNPILGWSKLLQRNATEPNLVRGLETIERNAKLQVQLIDDLLDVSRILRGKLVLNRAPVFLPDVVSAALETVELAAQAKAIDISTDLDPTVKAVLGDAGRLQQVVWNLLSNAVKFTPEHGTVKVTLMQLGLMAAVQVSDTGKGISPDFVPFVFESFRQEDNATTRKFGGLGLGLAIARQLVELHGGTIKAESLGEGQGATFTILLPLP